MDTNKPKGKNRKNDADPLRKEFRNQKETKSKMTYKNLKQR